MIPFPLEHLGRARMEELHRQAARASRRQHKTELVTVAAVRPLNPLRKAPAPDPCVCQARPA